MPRAVEPLDRLLLHRDPTFLPPPLDGPLAEAVLGPSGAPGTPHRRLLEAMNGGYLFNRALHLFGACEAPAWHSLRAWNAADTWRDAYPGGAAGLVFFAEDAFGDQFAYTGSGGEVVVFEAEIARVARVAPSFVDWLAQIVDQPGAILPLDVIAAQPPERRQLQPGTQLFAYPPLFTVEAREGVSIGHVDAVEAMRFRGQLATRIQGLPTGTRIEIRVDED